MNEKNFLPWKRSTHDEVSHTKSIPRTKQRNRLTVKSGHCVGVGYEVLNWLSLRLMGLRWIVVWMDSVEEKKESRWGWGGKCFEAGKPPMTSPEIALTQKRMHGRAKERADSPLRLYHLLHRESWAALCFLYIQLSFVLGTTCMYLQRLYFHNYNSVNCTREPVLYECMVVHISVQASAKLTRRRYKFCSRWPRPPLSRLWTTSNHELISWS